MKLTPQAVNYEIRTPKSHTSPSLLLNANSGVVVQAGGNINDSSWFDQFTTLAVEFKIWISRDWHQKIISKALHSFRFSSVLSHHVLMVFLFSQKMSTKTLQKGPCKRFIGWWTLNFRWSLCFQRDSVVCQFQKFCCKTNEAPPTGAQNGPVHYQSQSPYVRGKGA